MDLSAVKYFIYRLVISVSTTPPSNNMRALGDTKSASNGLVELIQKFIIWCSSKYNPIKMTPENEIGEFLVRLIEEEMMKGQPSEGSMKCLSTLVSTIRVDDLIFQNAFMIFVEQSLQYWSRDESIGTLIDQWVAYKGKLANQDRLITLFLSRALLFDYSRLAYISITEKVIRLFEGRVLKNVVAELVGVMHDTLLRLKRVPKKQSFITSLLSTPEPMKDQTIARLEASIKLLVTTFKLVDPVNVVSVDSGENEWGPGLKEPSRVDSLLSERGKFQVKSGLRKVQKSKIKPILSERAVAMVSDLEIAFLVHFFSYISDFLDEKYRELSQSSEWFPTVNFKVLRKFANVVTLSYLLVLLLLTYISYYPLIIYCTLSIYSFFS